MSDPLEALAVDLDQVHASGDAEAALRQIIAFVQSVNADPAAAGHIFSSSRLDHLLARTAAVIPPPPLPAAPDPDPTVQVYLATELYLAGGHTRVLEDYIAAQPGRPHHVLLTNLRRRTLSPEIVQRLAALGAEIAWPDEPGLTATAQWVAARLAKHPRARVFAFVHHEDAPAWAGCLLARPARLYLCHHADHHLALGLHLPGVQSIEFTPFSFHRTASMLGPSNVFYIPLTSREIPARPAQDFSANPHDPDFITCSSGNAGKFRGDYAFSYASVIADRLARFGGRHLHIGGLDETTATAIHTACSTHSLDPARLVHVPQVPDLGAAMQAHHVSIYISSFPIVGARASIEVMASGTPIVGHQHLSNEFLGGEFLLPTSAPVWPRPADLWSILDSMTSSRQSDLGAAARSHWELNHRPDILARCLAQEITGAAPPEQPSRHQPDPLHQFFARRGNQAAITTHHEAANRVLALEERLARAHTSLEKARLTIQRLRHARTDHPGWIERLVRPLARLEKSVRKRLP